MPGVSDIGIVLRDYPVLYVDDELPNLDVFEATFGDQFVVHVASSGQEALEILDEERVAVVVADNRMPEMTGIELFAAIAERFPRTRRVLCTAYSDQRTAIEAINRAGVQHYLVKPWDVDEVESLLRGLVASAHLEHSAFTMRRGAVDQERRAALATMRRKLTLDLGNAVSVIQAVGRDLADSVREADAALPPTLRADFADHAATVVEVGRSLARLHRAARETHEGAPKAREASAQDIVDTVARIVWGDLVGAARLEYSAEAALHVWGDTVSITRILEAAVAWCAAEVREAGVRPALVWLTAQLQDDFACFEVRCTTDQGWDALDEAVALGVEASPDDPHLRTLALAQELADAMAGRFDVARAADGDAQGTRITLKVPQAR